MNASNTSSRGAVMTREITISRSAVADCAGVLVLVVARSATPRFCLLEVLDVRVQPVEALVPEPLEPAGPLVDRSQPAGVEAVQALLAVLRSRTSPTSRSTRRCLDAPGWVIPSSWANSVTGRSPARSSTRISRRCGSAIALKTSDVVVARATAQSYAHIGMRQVERNQTGLVR